MKKDEIAQLKQKLSWSKIDYESEKSRCEKFRQYAYDLEQKLNIALDRLEVIAEGRTYVGENTSKETAAIGLKKIARMHERKP